MGNGDLHVLLPSGWAPLSFVAGQFEAPAQGQAKHSSLTHHHHHRELDSNTNGETAATRPPNPVSLPAVGNTFHTWHDNKKPVVIHSTHKLNRAGAWARALQVSAASWAGISKGRRRLRRGKSPLHPQVQTTTTVPERQKLLRGGNGRRLGNKGFDRGNSKKRTSAGV